MSEIYKKYLPWALVSVVTTIVASGYFIVSEPLTNLGKTLSGWGVIIISFSLIPAVAFITYSNIKKIQKRTEEYWYLSIWFLVLLYFMLGVGLTLGMGHDAYTWIYSNVSMPIYSTVAATTALYIFSASYKAFKVRNLNSLLFVGTVAIVILGQTTLFETLLPALTDIRLWIWDVIVATTSRTTLLCMAIGFFALVIRMMFGRERPWGEA